MWRSQISKPIEEYELTTVTYGTASAPFLAIRTLQQLAVDSQKNYPEAGSITLRDFYVDDLLSGADSVADAQALQKALVELLQSGGFTLRKWSSNSAQFLDRVPKELQDKNTLVFGEEEAKKSLGILWNPGEDTFLFREKSTNAKQITKRHVLTVIAKIFDPLGWLAPFVIQAKLLIQDLWLQQMSWDEPIPDKIAKKMVEI